MNWSWLKSLVEKIEDAAAMLWHSVLAPGLTSIIAQGGEVLATALASVVSQVEADPTILLDPAKRAALESSMIASLEAQGVKLAEHDVHAAFALALSTAAAKIKAAQPAAAETAAQGEQQPEAQPQPEPAATDQGTGGGAPAAVKSIAALIVAFGVALAAWACTTSGTPWTPLAAAYVEVNGAIAVEVQLKALEAQMPAQVPLIQAAGKALASGVIGQSSAWASGSSPAQSAEQGVLSAVAGNLPDLSALISAAQANPGSVSWVTNVEGLLEQDAIYVGPAALKAVGGTVAPADLTSAQQTLSTAAAAL